MPQRASWCFAAVMIRATTRIRGRYADDACKSAAHDARDRYTVTVIGPVYLMPPFIITPDQLAHLCAAVRAVVTDLTRGQLS